MQALQQLGWSEGRKLRIDRWGRGNAADTRKIRGGTGRALPDVLIAQ